MPTMRPALRKLTLTAHVVVSIGWFGAATGVLALGIVGLTSEDAGLVSAAYLATEVIWKFVIIPFSLAALVTGLVQALGTQWGLFRHYWVVTKFLITIGAVILLLLHTGSLLPALVSSAQSAPRVEGVAGHHHGGIPPRIHLVVAASGTLVLLFIATTLSIYKPWGRTRFARRNASAV